MLVQTHFPQKLSPKRYDQFLAKGWFRGSVMLYKMDLLCMDDDLFSVINIRLNLEKHEFKKSLRKILNRGNARFEVIISPVSLNQEKEALYQIQKAKFKGFIHKTLHEFLYSGFQNTVFDTYEINLLDNGKLVAASYFDLGEKGVASLLGMYLTDYNKYSLGVFTMLLEIEFAKANGFKWYYPGYILNNHNGFDYKLRLGEFEYYNHNKRWTSFSQEESLDGVSERVKRKNRELEKLFQEAGIKYRKLLYPYFGIGYMHMWEVTFLKLPIVFELDKKDDGTCLLLGYDLDDEEYNLSWCEHAVGHEHLINMSLSAGMKDSDTMMLKLLRYSEIISKSKSAVKMNQIVLNQLSNAT